MESDVSSEVFLRGFVCGAYNHMLMKQSVHHWTKISRKERRYTAQPTSIMPVYRRLTQATLTHTDRHALGAAPTVLN